MKKIEQKLLSIVPKVARKLGENSVDAACSWWIYQPKIPTSMTKEGKK